MKKFLAVLIGGLLIAAPVNAEVRTYEGVGEYVMSDFETPDVAKQRAKQRAEAAAQEQAGVFVKSNTKVVNLQMQSEEIEVMTAGIMKVHSVSYDVRPDSAGFVFVSKVSVDIDTDEIDKWLAQNEDTKADLLEQNKSLQNALAEQEKQLAALKAKLAEAEKNQSTELSPAVRLQMTREFANSDGAFLSDQQLKAGNAAHNRGDFRGAISAYTQAIEFNPSNVAALIWRGNAFGSLREFQNAKADFTRAIQLGSRDAIAYVGLGIVYFSLREYSNAISVLNEAIELNGKNAKAYYTRSRCFAALGYVNDARRDAITAEKLGYRR